MYTVTWFVLGESPGGVQLKLKNHPMLVAVIRKKLGEMCFEDRSAGSAPVIVRSGDKIYARPNSEQLDSSAIYRDFLY